MGKCECVEEGYDGFGVYSFSDSGCERCKGTGESFTEEEAIRLYCRKCMGKDTICQSDCVFRQFNFWKEDTK